jgi:hypothetical protein
MRLDALGLDASTIQAAMPGEFARLAKTCNNCQFKDKCEQDLLGEFGTGRRSGWRHYCPNAASLVCMRDGSSDD